MKTLETTDYNIFKMDDRNRPLKKNHVENIVSSMTKSGYLPYFPIIVDKDMKVIDGQHRLEACKQLKIPVTYIMEKGGNFEGILHSINNARKNWTADDYLRLYVYTAKPEYIKLKEDLDKLPGINVSEFIDAQSGARSDCWNKFKAGEYVHCQEKIKHIIDSRKNVLDCFKLLYEGSIDKAHWLNNAMVKSAIRIVLSHSEIDISVFKSKLKLRASAFVRCSTKAMYVSQFFRMYNYKSQRPIRTF